MKNMIRLTERSKNIPNEYDNSIKNVSPVNEVNFLTAVYPSGQMNLPSLNATSSTIFPESKIEVINIPL